MNAELWKASKDKEDQQKNKKQAMIDQYMESLKSQGIDIKKIDMSKISFEEEEDEYPEVVE